MAYAHEVYRYRRVSVAYAPSRELQQLLRRRYHDADGFATHAELRLFIRDALIVGVGMLLEGEEPIWPGRITA